MKIAVIGSNGQLGWELSQLASDAKEIEWFFADRSKVDVTQEDTINRFIQEVQPNYLINCTAYTAVDKAESDQETAYKVNAQAVGNMAQICAQFNIPFITVSTDYVFNGKGTHPYETDMPAEPVNYYGYTKWKGEQLALSAHKKTVIIRTSWVYSVHGNNFVKTMRRLMAERASINVVSDQVGAPTYAADLAEAILQIIKKMEEGNAYFGVYHFSNTGVISWHQFAEEIKRLSNLQCDIHPIPTEAYPTPAKRPSYSVMNCAKIVTDYGIELKDWKTSLNKCIDQMQ